MNRNLVFLCSLLLMLITSDATARDTIKQWPIADVLENSEYAERLQGVSFYFGDQSHPSIVENFGEYRTNKKTNGFNKSDEEACQWVMLTALLQLHQRAVSLGANAVVNIRSNYKNKETSSDTEYTCGSGALMSGVALIGTFVTVD